MTALHPTMPATYPRSPRRVPATSAFWATLQCICTLGLWPLLVWPTRWSTFVEGERRELLNLANAWRRRVVGRNAEQLDSIARKFRPRPMLMVICWLVVGFNAAIFALLLMRDNPPHDLWDLTFGHRERTETQIRSTVSYAYHIEHRFDPPYWPRTPQVFSIDVPLIREPEANLYQIWLGSLLLGYICHWYAVRSHAVAVKQLVDWTNRLARQNHFEAINQRPTRLGLNPLWIIFTIGFCANAAWWAIPMALAGAMQRRYITRTSPEVRRALSEQAQLGFALVNIEHDRFCTASRCGARVPGKAKFCPRCGTAV